MADASVKINVVWDFTGVAAAFRTAAEAFDALQANLSPDSPAAPDAPAAASEHDTAGEDPQGP